MQHFLDESVVAGVHPVGAQSGGRLSQVIDDAPGIVDDRVSAKDVAVVPFPDAVHPVFHVEVGGHDFYFGFREAKTVLHFGIEQGGHRRIVEVAEDAFLGHFEYPDDHRLFQIGVVLEGLHHEAADEGNHFIVEAAGVGGMQRSVVLVQKDVDRLVVGALEPSREMFY